MLMMRAFIIPRIKINSRTHNARTQCMQIVYSIHDKWRQIESCHPPLLVERPMSVAGFAQYHHCHKHDDHHFLCCHVHRHVVVSLSLSCFVLIVYVFPCIVCVHISLDLPLEISSWIDFSSPPKKSATLTTLAITIDCTLDVRLLTHLNSLLLLTNMCVMTMSVCSTRIHACEATTTTTRTHDDIQ